MKVFSLVFLLFVVVLSGKAQSTFTVTRSDDRGNPVCAPGDCSLREAVNAANASSTDDTINFASGLATITLTNEIVINKNPQTLTIAGNGANVLTIDGDGKNRIFSTNSATVTISGVTLAGGNSIANGGGAIYALGGSLILNRVHITGNNAPLALGGGVDFLGGTHRMLNSTFSDNTASSCGGFYNESGMLTVINSTISGNKALDSSGGGFCSTGTTMLRNVTITNNSAPYRGGGIFQRGGTLSFGNTIVAGNTTTSGVTPEIWFEGGAIASAGGNLVGVSPGDSTNTGNSINYQPTDIQDINPKLGILRNNGGTTPTHALLAGSPAIDAGRNTQIISPFISKGELAFDQRGAGFPRTVDGDGNGTAIIDIGAFEFQRAPTAAAVSVSGRVTNSHNRGIANAVVRLTKQNGETQVTGTNFFGYYTFKELAVGETYIFEVYAKHYQISPQAMILTEDLTELNFSAEPIFGGNLNVFPQ